MPKTLQNTILFTLLAQLRELIQALPVGSPLPTVNELMQRYGMSHGTIIRALANLADQGVIARPWGKKRYVIAESDERALRKICVIRPDYPAINVESIFREIYERGDAEHWHFDQYSYRHWQSLDLARLSKGKDAIVLYPESSILSQEFIKSLLRPKLPVLVLAQHIQSDRLINICIDDFNVGKKATEFLLSKGHRHILLVKDQPLETTISERIRGFRSAMETASLHDDIQILDSQCPSFGDAIEYTYRALTRFFDSPHPPVTAIFATSICGGIAALRVLNEHSIRIPQDVAVLSFNEFETMPDYLNPKLSTIEPDTNAMTDQVITTLKHVFQNTADTRIPPLQTSLILRQTT